LLLYRNLALRRNSMKWPIGGGFRISGCRLRSTVLPARPWTGGLPSGLQELNSFPGAGRVPDSHDRPAIPLKLLHSMKVDRSFSPPTALLPRFDTRRLVPVPGGDGTTPVPERGREQSAWQVPAATCGPGGLPVGCGFLQDPISIGPGRSGRRQPHEEPGAAFRRNPITPGAPQ
jgi:hypothetical protein